jgi:hypothetical protein
MQELTDDPTINDGEILYRRIPNVEQASFMVTDEVTKARRPTSAVFRPDKDGLSVYIDSILREYELSERDVQTRPESGVLSLTVGDVRAEVLGVAPDAWPKGTDDPTHLRNAAHALVVGFRSLSKSQLKVKQYALIGKCQILIDPLQP